MRTLTDAAAADAGAAARRHLDLARTEARRGSLERGWQESLSAAAIARALGDADLMAEAATVISEPSVVGRSAGARQGLCLEALGMLGAPPDDRDEPSERTHWRELVRTHLEGLSTGWADRAAPLEGRLDRADTDRRFAALQTAYLKALGVAGLPDRLALAFEGIRLGRASGDDHILAWGWHWRADALAQLGLRVDFDHAVKRLAKVVSRLDSPVWTWRDAAVRANIALLDDRVADVPELAGAALYEGRRAGVDDADLFDLVLRGVLAQRTGVGLARIEEEVRLFAADAPLFARGWHAEILLAMNRVGEAVEIHRALAPHLDEIPEDVHEWLVAHVTLADLAIAADDRDAATRVRDRLRPIAHLHAAAPVTTPYGGPIALPLARLSTFLGDHEDAARYAREALARADAMGAPWHAAAARAMLSSGRSALGPLSARESEVARLLADARTNRAIAETLFLSERTVEQHVRSILHKLELPNRSAVATWVVRTNSAPPSP